MPNIAQGAGIADDAISAVPELPQDALRCIALAALHTEDSSLEAWTRLSLVARSWRDWLAGCELHVEFSAPMTAEQLDWLRATRRPLRSICFHPDDPNSCQLLHDPGTLVSSEGSLQAAHHVRITADGAMLDRPVSLTRFGSLRDLRLSHANRWCLQPGQLPELPTSLTALALDSGPTSAPLPTGLQLQHLVALQSLSLRNHSCHWTREGQQTMLLPPHVQLIYLKAPRVDLQQFLPSSSGPGPRKLTVVALKVTLQFVDQGSTQSRGLPLEFGSAAGSDTCGSVMCAGVSTLSLHTRQLSIEYVRSAGASVIGNLEFLSNRGAANIARLVGAPSAFRQLVIRPAAPGELIKLACFSELQGAVIVGVSRVPSWSAKYSLPALAREFAGPCWDFGLLCELRDDGRQLRISKP